MPAEPLIDCDFPGGNIIVEKIDGDTAFVRQDLRDTEGDWFYWHFRVRGAAGRTIRFRFTGTDVFGAAGPAVSTDASRTWRWLGRDSFADKAFAFAFPPGAADVRFCFAIPYVESNLRQFLARIGHSASTRSDTPIVRDAPILPDADAGANLVFAHSVLCRSRKGRDVELLRFGCIGRPPHHRVLLACRHHCCEMMAGYELEGVIEAVLADDADGDWFRRTVEFLAVPFMDKDGVEDGDQGKNRRPYDHNRDYDGDVAASIYPETAALRRLIAEWSQGRLRMAFDLHCPWIRGPMNEDIFFVGTPDQRAWEAAGRFSTILERERHGPLPFDPAKNLPFGKDWNTGAPPGQKSFGRWAGELPGVAFGTTIELPYAVAGGVPVTPESARAFGKDLAKAMRTFIESECE